ncbi:minichromosome maintenance protein MCM [Candidatus Woesearchaeota archaeon]|nr:minichromosome maintenance protein MCM [Candidatus Woesearchaeota archaeon]
MEVQTQIRVLQEFLERHYHSKLLDAISKGDRSLKINFALLAKFNPEIADILLDQPEETLKALEIAVEQFDLPNQIKNFTIRIDNLPRTQRVLLRDIRSEHLGKFLWFEGVVRQKSDVRPQVTAARFECPSCGNIIPVLQLDKQFKEPSKCGCGRKGKFNLLSKELIDAQHLKLEELSEDLEGGDQPKRMNIFLKNDLVSPINEKKTSPGSAIKVMGVVKEVPVIMRTGSKSTVFDLLIEANNIEAIQEDYTDIKISKEDIKKIKEIGRDPNLYQKMISSVAPSIYGHELIKEALVLQLMGGVRKQRKDGVTTRGDIHVLLVGDPGSGKSQMIRRVQKVAPKGKYVSGKGASGAGLTASVVKDEFLQDWALEAGALVLANKGMCCIDELDKMSRDDTSAMHEALEQQTVTISKANIQATLRSETTVLAAANPKFGRFDPYSTIAEQINLPVTLINRFDLIFPVRDMPDEKKDSQLASFILKVHQNLSVAESPLDTEFLRKYVAYVRQNVFPNLTDSAIEELKKYYLQMRNSGNSKSVPITARQLEGLVRLAEANARLRLADKITRTDAQKAVNLVHHCLKLIAFDEETGTFDVDRIATDTPGSQRNKILTIKEIINDLEGKIGKTIPMDDIEEMAREKGLNDEDITEVVDKLKRSGDIFEPKRGFIQKI